MRKVHTLDACHLSSTHRGTMSNIIQGLPNSEGLTDSFSVDALNESKSLWSLVFECDRNALGRRSHNYPCEIFICDRLKGQHKTISSWYPEVRVDDCSFHLMENMEKKKNSGAKKEDLALFKKYYFSKTIAEAIINRTEFCNNISPSLLAYMNKSIFAGNSHPSRFCDAYVVSQAINNEGHFTNEREDVRASTWSESFNSALLKERSFPLPVLIYQVIIREYRRMNELLTLYMKWDEKGLRFPCSISQAVFLNTPIRTSNYQCILTGIHQGTCSYHLNDDHRHITHNINFSVKPLQCTDNCVLRTGIPCALAISFILFCEESVEDQIPHKFSIEAGIDVLKHSLGSLRDKPIFAINFNSLQISTPTIVPPHSRAPRGRPKKKRITKRTRKRIEVGNKLEIERRLAHTTPIEEQTRSNPNASNFERIDNNNVYKCSLCGGVHNRKQCLAPHDGMGKRMSTKEQDDFIKKGFLIIEIKPYGETIIPESPHQFQRMRQLSKFSTKEFEDENIDRLKQNIRESHYPNPPSSYQLRPRNNALSSNIVSTISRSTQLARSMSIPITQQSVITDVLSQHTNLSMEEAFSDADNYQEHIDADDEQKSSVKEHYTQQEETSSVASPEDEIDYDMHFSQDMATSVTNKIPLFPDWIINNVDVTIKFKSMKKHLFGKLIQCPDDLSKWKFIGNKDVAGFPVILSNF